MSWSATGRRTGVVAVFAPVANAGGATVAASACVADAAERDGVCGGPITFVETREVAAAEALCPADCMVTATVGVVEAVAWVVVAKVAGWSAAFCIVAFA